MGGQHADELLPTPFRALSPPSSSAAGPLLCGRRSPIAGAILFLGISIVSAAIACRTGCAFSHRRLPFLREEAFTELYQREAYCLCQYSAWLLIWRILKRTNYLMLLLRSIALILLLIMGSLGRNKGNMQAQGGKSKEKGR